MDVCGRGKEDSPPGKVSLQDSRKSAKPPCNYQNITSAYCLEVAIDLILKKKNHQQESNVFILINRLVLLGSGQMTFTSVNKCKNPALNMLKLIGSQMSGIRGNLEKKPRTNKTTKPKTLGLHFAQAHTHKHKQT